MTPIGELTRFITDKTHFTSLDGVFYCDLRPNMKTDPFLAQRIRGIDELFFGELQRLGLA